MIRISGGTRGFLLLPLFALMAPGCMAVSSSVAPTHSSGAGARFLHGDFERELLLTGEMESVRSIAIKAPQTSMFQMRIQFMADEGAVVRRGDPLLSFESSALAARVHDLETNILDAETQIVSRRNELASALKDLEIELAEKTFEHDRARLDASIDPDVLSRKVHAERELAFATARRQLDETKERIRLTRERGKAEMDVLIINRDKLRKDLLSTQNDLELLTLKAPADGLVVYESREGTTLRYQEGDSCWPGQGVMRLPDLTEMQVLFLVNEVDAPLLKVGAPVEVRLDAYPERKLAAVIRSIPSMAVRRTDESKIAIFRVIASLSETWEGEMKPGMSVRGRLVLEQRANAPLVAREAVESDGTRFWMRDDSPEGASGNPGHATEIHPLARSARHYLLSEEEFSSLTAAGGKP